MPAERPYTPESLADRWGCSPEKVRRMYHDGQVAGFRLGKLIRIPASEVARIECQTGTDSESTGDDTASSTTTQSEAAFESRLARMTGGSRNLALVTSGGRETPHHRNG
jgi:excisionase family DNA binding protein